MHIHIDKHALNMHPHTSCGDKGVPRGISTSYDVFAVLSYSLFPLTNLQMHLNTRIVSNVRVFSVRLQIRMSMPKLKIYTSIDKHSRIMHVWFNV